MILTVVSSSIKNNNLKKNESKKNELKKNESKKNELKKNESKKNELKKNELKTILKTHKKMYFMSKILLEKIEINSDLNIDNDFYVYKYFELQRKYVQMERKIKELYKDINT